MIAVMGGLVTTARAVPGQTDTASTTGTVEVGSSITLTGLTPTFTVSGNPGETDTAVVTMTVITNNAEGYAVTVEPQTATLDGVLPGNTDTIPVSDLEVRETGGGAFTPLIFGTPVETHTQAAPSAEAGDLISNDYQITIPFVAPDTYSVVLDYVVTTL